MSIFHGIGNVALDVLLALLPLILVFSIYQIFLIKLPLKKIAVMGRGMVFTFVGLVLFLQGVHVGFLPVGNAIGDKLAGMALWLLPPLGLVLGVFSTLAEPAVRVLVDSVEKVTGGHINKKLLLYTLCVGVSVAVGLSMLRLTLGISLLWFIVPIYVAVFIMAFFAPNDFVAVAFDAGGVATGPMTVTFILAISVGAANAIPGRSVIADGFGIIAMVAAMPIITVLTLGVLYRIQEGKYARKRKN
jgi:hypothetical protein